MLGAWGVDVLRAPLPAPAPPVEQPAPKPVAAQPTNELDQQIEAMSRMWPAFKLVRREGSAALRQGTVRPLLQTYRVSVGHRLFVVFEQNKNRAPLPEQSAVTLEWETADNVVVQP